MLALGTEGQREAEGSPAGLSPHTQGGDRRKEAVRESERYIDQERLERKGQVKQIWRKEGTEEKNNATQGMTGDKKK